MMGLWNNTYSKDIPRERYGNELTYVLAEKFLHSLDIEDWGCGTGRFKDYHIGGYLGVDGSRSKYCDLVADLRKRKSHVPGILLRHVIEHNVAWRTIVKNAIASATKTVVIVLFTPFQEKTHAIGWSDEIGVPDIGFSLDEMRAHLPKKTEEHLNISSPSTQYGVEHLFVVEK
jgi:hypothetical protein